MEFFAIVLFFLFVELQLQQEWGISAPARLAIFGTGASALGLYYVLATLKQAGTDGDGGRDAVIGDVSGLGFVLQSTFEALRVFKFGTAIGACVVFGLGFGIDCVLGFRCHSTVRVVVAFAMLSIMVATRIYSVPALPVPEDASAVSAVEKRISWGVGDAWEWGDDTKEYSQADGTSPGWNHNILPDFEKGFGSSFEFHPLYLDVYDAYQVADFDGSGKVSKFEMTQYLAKDGLTKDDVVALGLPNFDVLNTGTPHDTVVSQADLEAYVAKQHGGELSWPTTGSWTTWDRDAGDEDLITSILFSKQ